MTFFASHSCNIMELTSVNNFDTDDLTGVTQSMYRFAYFFLGLVFCIMVLTGCSIMQTEASNSALSIERRTVVFEVYGVSFLNPFDSRYIITGETVKAASDGSNVYLESSNGRLTPLLSPKRSKTAEIGTQSAASLHQALNPRPVQEGARIVYTSNKQASSLESSSIYSLFIMNADGSDNRLLLSGDKFGSLSIVDTLGSLVYAAGDDNSLVVIDVTTNETKKYMLEGRVDAISDEGSHVLYRMVKDGYVYPELWMFNITNSSAMRIGPQPQNYFISR